MNLDWALNTMPNGMMFSITDGKPIHPDWIFITQDHSMYAVKDNIFYAIAIDCGIMKYGESELLYPPSSSITTIINYWTQEMVVPDDDDYDVDSVIIGYAAVPKNRMTRFEQREALTYISRRVGAITGAIARPISTAASSIRSNLHWLRLG